MAELRDSRLAESPGLFDGLTAWFSSSVPLALRDLWKGNGGDEEEVGIAMMVFSTDANTPDTKKLYSSKAYLTDNLAIFHASYIQTCVRNGNTKTVSIGKFLLPPVQLYEKIKDIVDYGYTYTIADESQPSSQTNIENASINGRVNNSHTHSVPSQKQVVNVKLNRISSNDQDYSEYVRIENLSTVTGPLADFEAGHNFCEVIKR